MQELINNPESKQQLIAWIEDSLKSGKHLLATSNQGTLLLFQQNGKQCVIKAAMGKTAVYKARLATLRREYQAYQKIKGVKNTPLCYGFLARKYLILEYIEGCPYRQANWDDREQWFSQFKQTLSEIHQRGVAHGDLKSKSNIIVTSEQRPCIIDFGTAIIYKPGWHPINHWLFNFACRIDRNAWVKHKYYGNYAAASETDSQLLQYSFLEKILRKTRRRN